VAVVDQGILVDSLPDVLKNTIFVNTNVENAQLVERHGTMVASQLAARGNNSTGMTGVMWRPARPASSFRRPLPTAILPR
jgi:hypothetical protein